MILFCSQETITRAWYIQTMDRHSGGRAARSSLSAHRASEIPRLLRGLCRSPRIREAQLQKIPYMLVIGDKEVEQGTVTPRYRDGKNLDRNIFIQNGDIVEVHD